MNFALKYYDLKMRCLAYGINDNLPWEKRLYWWHHYLHISRLIDSHTPF